MSRTSTVEPLRADVHLLGDLLGRVLVEQEGEAFLSLEERIRALARDARGRGDRAELDEAVASLDVDTQGRVLAAFSLFCGYPCFPTYVSPAFGPMTSTVCPASFNRRRGYCSSRSS